MFEITVTDNTKGLAQRIGKLSKDKGLGTYAANMLQEKMRQFIPERDSILIDSYSIKPWQVTYKQPYAKAMYYGIVKGTKVTYHKPTATSKWEKQVDKASFAKELEDYIKRIL